MRVVRTLIGAMHIVPLSPTFGWNIFVWNVTWAPDIGGRFKMVSEGSRVAESERGVLFSVEKVRYLCTPHLKEKKITSSFFYLGVIKTILPKAWKFWSPGAQNFTAIAWNG